jgi:hypothetical protein
LCDDNHVALFAKCKVKIVKNGQVIVSGQESAANGLWNIPLTPSALLVDPAPHNFALGAIQQIGAKQDLAAFLPACVFSPILSTFPRAIERAQLKSWPGLTTSLFAKHLAKSLATCKGHVRMQQQNTQSTKITSDLPVAASLNFSPSQELQNKRTDFVFASILPATELKNFTRTKQASAPSNRFVATSTSWSSMTATLTPLSPRC